MPGATQPHVLLVEDERSLALLYSEYIKTEDIRLTHVASGREAIAMLDSDAPDVILLDIRLPDMMGTQVLEQITERGLNTAVIMITAHGSINTAVETMRSGAYDFLVKPFNKDRLLQTLTSALNRQQVTVQVKRKEVSYHAKGFQGFIGESKPMQVVYRMIEAASSSKASVFITGESGTGKEVAAEAIHKLSPRAKKPFVVLNCAAIPRDLMESEIFGHIKGAFTGAVSDHDGAATRAHGGTLFLDEICEMDLHLQSKLLRFIQTGTFNKVGSGKMEKVDIRFVSATNRDPLMEIGAGRFREDLYYRLHVVPVPLPALRDRVEDIIPIATHFLQTAAEEEGRDFTSFGDDARQRLETYSWPGNVRQLQNVIRNTVVLNKGEEVAADMLPPPLNTDNFTASSLASMGHHGKPMMPAAYGAPAQSPYGGAPALPPKPHYLPQGTAGMGTPNGQPANASMQPSERVGEETIVHPASLGQGLAGGNSLVGFPKSGGDHNCFASDANAPAMAAFAPTPQLSEPAPSAAPAGKASIQPLWETERNAILEAIDSCGGNIPKAAALLGISASTIYRKKQAWEANGQS